MTKVYYTKRILPVYIGAIESMRRSRDIPQPESPQEHHQFLLQEDGDGSHGLRKKGPAQDLRDAHCIQSLAHPPQSPDLNPIEACWNVIKQRARQKSWESIEELKQVLQAEWTALSQEEVQKRIEEMPERCRQLLKSDGVPFKSTLW